MDKKFSAVAATEKNPLYAEYIKRENALYGETSEDFRTPFERDYTRLLHSRAYRRLKHKTQVFYNIESDHICTRAEHVLHVESVAYTIAKSLGLNEELTRRGESFNYYPLSAYNDLYQYISLTSVSPEKSVYAERFIEYILKEEVQKSLGKICMFSAFYASEQETEVLNDLQRIKSESTFSVFSAKESYKELQKLAELTATGKEKDLTKLKKFLA